MAAEVFCHYTFFYVDLDCGQIDDVQMNKTLEMIESGKSDGAKLCCGGRRIGDKGYFVEPTVFADVDNSMRIAREEVWLIQLFYLFIYLFNTPDGCVQ